MPPQGNAYRFHRVISYYDALPRNPDDSQAKLDTYRCKICQKYTHSKHTTALARHLKTCPKLSEWEIRFGSLDLGDDAGVEIVGREVLNGQAKGKGAEGAAGWTPPLPEAGPGGGEPRHGGEPQGRWKVLGSSAPGVEPGMRLAPQPQPSMPSPSPLPQPHPPNGSAERSANKVPVPPSRDSTTHLDDASPKFQEISSITNGTSNNTNHDQMEPPHKRQRLTLTARHPPSPSIIPNPTSSRSPSATATATDANTNDPILSALNQISYHLSTLVSLQSSLSSTLAAHQQQSPKLREEDISLRRQELALSKARLEFERGEGERKRNENAMAERMGKLEEMFCEGQERTNGLFEKVLRGLEPRGR
ncbi:hypothetical protein MMC10_008191 [Thelotrema lepadinum]|nr:hypothetical protein [Thelotrema lepadinum]